VIAVQDGRITNIGHNARLGRFVQLQDVYGNTYTYGQLAKVARTYPVAVEQSVKNNLVLPSHDPAPTRPATAGRQAATAPQRVAAAAVRAAASSPSSHNDAAAPVTARRLYAHPPKGRAVTKALDAIFESERHAVLRKGSRVVAGTILGRIGTISKRQAPHVRFEIRPAGKDAPRIDPKPILDGWKLLESTAIYRAAGKNPFFGPDAKNPSIGQILLLSKEALQKRVLEDPRIDIYPGGRQDIQAGQIDRRVLATLEFLSASGLKPTVSCLKTGHSLLTTSGNVSEHSSGNAVDISAINGVPIAGHQGDGSITDITIRRLLTLQGTMKPHQIISLMTYQGTDNTLALPDHADHIHVGFHPLYGTNTKLARQLDSVLKPGQWIKLINRIGKIDLPEVRSDD
jgi:hypothetical protein